MTLLDGLYAVWGFAMAALIGYGFSAIIYKEYRYGIPSALAGIALYVALWFTIP